MKKLVNINRRRPQNSKSVSTLSLPPIKKFSIPRYEDENNKIAKKIIESKSSISCKSSLVRYRSVEAQKKNIAQYQSEGGSVINRKKYLAELMLLKKMRVGEEMKSSRQA